VSEVKFALARLAHGGRELWLDGNSKITGPNGTFADPKPCSFSLVQVADCPHRTPTCQASCYVHGLEKHASEIHEKYRQNSVTLREILADNKERVRWSRILADWIEGHCAHARGGFRWHVSGDVFSIEHARWIALVAKGSPGVGQWIYTRSFPYLEPLLGIPNLTVNLSCDRDNYHRAWEVSQRYAQHELRLCYLSAEGEVPSSLVPGLDVVFPDYGLRGRDLSDPREAPWWQSLSRERRKMVCPVDFFGGSEKIRCGKCKKCL
jgi:hypothetical protein